MFPPFTPWDPSATCQAEVGDLLTSATDTGTATGPVAVSNACNDDWAGRIEGLK